MVFQAERSDRYTLVLTIMWGVRAPEGKAARPGRHREVGSGNQWVVADINRIFDKLPRMSENR